MMTNNDSALVLRAFEAQSTSLVIRFKRILPHRLRPT